MNLRLLTNTPFAGVIIKKSWFARWFAILAIALINALNAYSQFSTTECTCLNNATAPGNGLFLDSIVWSESDPPQVWTIVSASGLYMPGSTPNSLIPFPTGFVVSGMSVMGQTTFIIEGLRVDGESWTVVVSDGNNEYVITNTHTCVYPPFGIDGITAVCQNGNSTYSLRMPWAGFMNLNWSLSGGGTIVGPTNVPSIGVNWGSALGFYTVNVTGEHAVSATLPGNVCDVNFSLDVEVRSNTPQPLACNNLVNLSTNANCELIVLPEAILEGGIINNDAYEVILTDIQADTIVPQGIIDQTYIGKILKVRVVDRCSGNSCWGNVLIEDKSIPPLVCGENDTLECNQLNGPEVTGFPFDTTASGIVITPALSPANTYIVSGFDNCSDVTLRYFDIATDVICNGPFSSIVERTWVATDISGNTSTCVDSIFVLNATLSDLVFPGSWDDVLGPNPSLDPCGNFPRLENGHPSPEFTGSPTGTFCLNVDVEYSDVKLPICTDGNSFKILRRWVVTDKCTNEVRTYVQTITVMDTEAPEAVAPPNFNVPTNPHSCASMIDVPPPIVISECSRWDYFVSYKLRDESGDPYQFATDDGVIRNPDGTYKITNVPAGQDSIWIVYTIVDACENVTQVFTEAAIIDTEEPVAICDQFSFVALNENGEAWATTLTFDDKSWDNCGIARFEVRRMTAGCNEENNWSDKVKFCCADIGQPVLVELRVYDHAGNSNTCMVNATVQDNRPPILFNCPANITVDCSAELINLSIYGTPTFEDDCGATLSEEVSRNFNDCGIGTIVRRFIATDNYGNTSQCSQVITVSTLNKFGLDDITWPADHTITNGCADSSISPENLPVGKRRPILSDVPCSRVAAEYDDIVFQYVDGVCFKVLRKWTVIDRCQFNPFVPNQGVWTHTQVIKVVNSNPPSITKGCNENDIEFTLVDDCRSRIVVRAEAQDDCTPIDQLKFSYQIDLNNDGIVEITGNGNRVDRIVNFGSHKVIWKVTDECGNESTCSGVFVIDDTKKPTPYCFSQIVTVIMPTTGDITIRASDFDAGSFDNCTPQNQLRFSFSSNVANTSRTFNCNDLTDQITYLSLPIYVTDLAGNFDFCSVTIQVQDNNNVCGFANGDDDEMESKLSIAGKVVSETQEPVAGVIVSLDADLPEFPKKQLTDSDGKYQFADLTPLNDYSVRLEREGSYKDGISTLDLVLIQRHILKVQELEGPYKIIAADVTGDDKISAADLVALRKLILGIENKFPSMPSWRFIDRYTEFSDPKQPFPVNDKMTMYDMSTSYLEADFVAIKLGDVNNTWLDNSNGGQNTENRNEVHFQYQAQRVRKGEIFKIALQADLLENLAGFQLVLKFDPRSVHLTNVLPGEVGLDNKYITFRLIEEGLLPISWNARNAIQVSGSPLFTLEFEALKDLNTANILGIDEHIFKPEIYLENAEQSIEVQVLQIRSTGLVEKDHEFELRQNIPNPFSHSTTISFVLPREGEVIVKFYDTAGRIVYTHQGYYGKGYNSFDVSSHQLTPGILYYQLESKTHISTRKMIVIK